MNKTKNKEKKNYSGDICIISEESVNFDETHRGAEILVDILVVMGGGAVERVYGRHLKYSYL